MFAEAWVFAVIVIFAATAHNYPTLTLFLVRVLRYQMLSCCLSRMFLSPFIVTPIFSDLDGGLCEVFRLLAPLCPSSSVAPSGFPLGSSLGHDMAQVSAASFRVSGANDGSASQGTTGTSPGFGPREAFT